MYHILVVDDNKANLAMAKQELSDEYQVTPVISGAQALQFLEKKTPSLIMLDLMMPEMDGRETMKRIREREEWTKIPIIFLTADSSPETESEILRLGADDFVAKPFVPEVMKSRISRIIELNELRNDLEARLAEKTAELERVTINAIMAISSAIEAKDEYTRGHSARVAECSEALARRLGWSDEECQNLRYIALLHDIGKIGVPDSVLNKPARLTNEEFSIIKKHPVTGGEILKGLKSLPHVEEGALYHHERYDGSGYPNGLKGEDIPLWARIIGIADSYDAMTSNRVYRKKQSVDYVISEFQRCSGSQFDPQLAAVFIEMLREGFTLYGDDTAEVKTFTLADSDGGVDVMTGLMSPETSELRVNELLTCGRKGTMLLFSPDNLMQLVELLGQAAADDIMKNCADILKSHAGENDLACRIDGDAIGLFLADNSSADDAVKIAEKVLAEIRCYTETIASFRVSVSCGISMTGRCFDDHVRYAEKALYLASMTNSGGASVYTKPEAEVSIQPVLTDIDRLCTVIEETTSSASGAYTVGYEDFRKLYSYISRCIGRAHSSVEIMLFTLKSVSGEIPDSSVLEQSMAILAGAISGSLRISDVAARYSSCQCVVILPEASTDNAEMIAQRIAERFYKSCPDRNFELSYDFRGMNFNG